MHVLAGGSLGSVPLGSVGCRNRQQLLLGVAGSRCCGVLLSCESPLAVGGDAKAHLAPGGLQLPATACCGPSAAGALWHLFPPKCFGDWGAEQPRCGRSERDGAPSLRSPGSILPGASCPHAAEQRGLPGASRGRWPIHVRRWRRGLACRQGQGGRRAALRSPNAHVRKWLHFSERKREVGLPRRGSQQLPPLARGCRSCRLPRVHELALPGKVRSGEAALPPQLPPGSVPGGAAAVASPRCSHPARGETGTPRPGLLWARRGVQAAPRCL